MKFLIFNDFHISGRNPRSRLDNYYQSCLQKLDEIIMLSKDVDFVICTGDLWDSAVVANTLVDDIVDKIESSKKIWFFIYGNHDLISYNLETSKASSLAHMIRRSKYIQHLTELKFDDVYIKGYDCIYGIEDKIKQDGLLHTSNLFSIAIVHALIIPKPFFDNVSQVVIKDIKTNYDLIFSGHLHQEFDITNKKTRFINLNSLGRTAITEQHQPQIAILDTETQQATKIKLKSAKLANQIFDLNKFHELKENEKSIQEFLDSLQNVEFQGLGIRNQIINIAKQQKIEEVIVNYLFKKIEEIENVK